MRGELGNRFGSKGRIVMEAQLSHQRIPVFKVVQHMFVQVKRVNVGVVLEESRHRLIGGRTGAAAEVKDRFGFVVLCGFEVRRAGKGYFHLLTNFSRRSSPSSLLSASLSFYLCAVFSGIRLIR